MEIVFVFFYLILIYFAAYVAKTSVPSPLRKFYIPALTFKIVGAIAVGLIYQYYYGYGDTLRYHFHSKIISSTFWDDPILGLKLLTINLDNPDPNLVVFFAKNYFFGAKDPGSFLMVRLCGFIGIFSGHSYYSMAVIFAAIGFSGTWALFVTFYNIYPQLINKFALAVLFVPSVIFWGSGVLKDTLTFCGLGFLTYSIYHLFIQKKYSPLIIGLLIFNLWMILTLKIYILLCFLPAAIIWIFTSKSDKIKSFFLKTVLKITLGLLAIPIGYFITIQVSQVDTRYALENLGTTAKVTADWITYSSGETGSAYSLGDMNDFSLIGILKKVPLAINVTLFRPYLWEVKNIVMLFSALESLIILLLTIRIIFKVGFINFVRIINNSSITLFLAIFSLAFAFAVGFSTYNFGSLVRYKIPCIPFFLLLLFIVEHINNQNKRKTSPL